MTASTLEQRIKAEFDARAQRIRQSQEAHATEARARETRMVKFSEVCEGLHSLVQPRIEAFGRAFGKQVKITPTITPGERSATIVFMTDLANMTLTVRMAPDADITKLVMEYDLLILPMYFEYDRHARLETPLDHIDREAVAQWLDDRIISCVKSYLAIQDNEFYLRRVAKTPSVKPAS
ncbi:MAG: hypothetical protein IT436_14630 [Phycisphaerales bacterium]|nr:hypothetical protein [Phycisphaerales bacterium]